MEHQQETIPRKVLTFRATIAIPIIFVGRYLSCLICHCVKLTCIEFNVYHHQKVFIYLIMKFHVDISGDLQVLRLAWSNIGYMHSFLLWKSKSIVCRSVFNRMFGINALYMLVVLCAPCAMIKFRILQNCNTSFSKVTYQLSRKFEYFLE